MSRSAPLAIQSAYTREAARDVAEGEYLARNAMGEANTLGFVRVELEASLAIGEIQLREKKILPWVSNGLRKQRETRVQKVSSLFDGRQVRRDKQSSARTSRPGRRTARRERSRDPRHHDLHILAFDPPNRSIPLKNFLVAFQSEHRTDRTSPEGVGAHLPPVR
jgi:hypothetical protein